MIKEITLVFTPFSLQNHSEGESEIDKYKALAFNLWKNFTHRKCDEPYLEEILPTNTNPISLGQLCLASYLQARGIKVNYVHGDYFIKQNNQNMEDFISYLIDISSQSSLIGFYSMTPTIDVAMSLINGVKKKNPSIITVLGGPHGTYTDIEMLKKYKHLDVVSRGEGEETLYELALESSKAIPNFSNIKGITFSSRGNVVRNEDRELLLAENIPAPDYSLLPRDFNCLLTVMYARGCPFRCKFCAEGNIWRHKLRFRSAEHVAQEIKYINDNWPQRVIHICDSEIDAVPKKLEELLSAIEKLDINVKFTVNIRCDAHKRLTPAIVNRMKKIGVVAYLIGVESASDHMLECMGRQSVFSDFIKTIDLLNLCDAGFIFPGVMVGFPGETPETLRETKRQFLKLLREDRIDYFFPKLFIPYPGTEPYEKQKEYGIKLNDKWSEFARFGLQQPFKLKKFDGADLKTEMLDFYERIVECYETKNNQ